jgi:hypothetical protein
MLAVISLTAPIYLLTVGAKLRERPKPAIREKRDELLISIFD